MSGEAGRAKLDVEPVVPPPGLAPIANPITAGSPPGGNALAAIAPSEPANPIGLSDDDLARAMQGSDGRYFAGRILEMVERWGGLRAFERRNPRTAPLLRQRVGEVVGEPTYAWMLEHDAEILQLVRNSIALQKRAQGLADRMAGKPITRGYETAWQLATAYELDYALVATGYQKAGQGAMLGWQLMLEDVDAAAAHIDEAVQTAQTDAEAAAALAAQRKARAETLLGDQIGSRERLFWFDDDIELATLLAPEDGVESRELALTWARLAGRASAVVRLDGRYHVYGLNHDYDYSDIWEADWFEEARTRLVPEISRGSPDALAIVTRQGYVVTPRDGERFFGGAQSRQQSAFLRADLDVLEKRGDDIDAGAMLRQLALDMVLMRLSDTETRLKQARATLVPDLVFDPRQGVELQAHASELHFHILNAAQLAYDLSDPPTLEQRIMVQEELEQIGQMTSSDPIAASMVVNRRDADDTSRPKPEDYEDRVAGMLPGDALSLGLRELDEKLENVDKVRRYFYANPDAVYAFDELISSAREQFPQSQQLSLTLHMFQHTMDEIAGFVGMAAKELGLLVAGLLTEGPFALAIWGYASLRGASAVQTGFEHADRVAAMANLDFEGGLQLATPAEVRSAKRWAWIGLGLALLDAGMFVRSASHMFRLRSIMADPEVARLVQYSGKSFGEIAKDLGLTERALAAELATARGAAREELLGKIRKVNLEARLLRTDRFKNREGLVAEPYLERLPGETPQQLRKRTMDAIERAHDQPLIDAYDDAIQKGAQRPHESFEGISFDRADTKGTRFDAIERAIVFTRDASLNKFSVAEEVQHALDYTLGARNPKHISEMGRQALARSKGIAPSKFRALDELSNAEIDWINDWWHRRVFTRMMKNIDAGRFGLGYLKPRLPEVHALYQEIGGKLTLKEILEGTWSVIY